MNAAKYGFYEITKTLLSYGAEPNLRDSTGRAAWFMAICRGHYVTVETLLDGAASCHLQDELGQTPLKFGYGSWIQRILRLLEKRRN